MANESKQVYNRVKKDILHTSKMISSNSASKLDKSSQKNQLNTTRKTIEIIEKSMAKKKSANVEYKEEE